MLIGISEIFASVTGLEYAYTKAPPSMKSFVQSIYLPTNAFGSAVGEALDPVVYDPAILWRVRTFPPVAARSPQTSIQSLKKNKLTVHVAF